MFLSIFSRGEDVPDLIEVLGLKDWYLGLSDRERELLHNHSTAFSAGGEYNRLDQNVSSTSETAQGYLKSVGESAVKDKNYEFAEKVLLKALKLKDSNPVDRHFVYNSLIKMYYRQRDEKEKALENCIKFCREDIETIDEFLETWNGKTPRIPSFKRLAIIYEKQEKYRKAVDICEKALEKGLKENTESGFEGRKERLEQKINEKQ